MFDSDLISNEFITQAANVLGETESGLSGHEIIQYCTDYAVDFDVTIPHKQYPFEAPNKRTALKENSSKFSPKQQYKIIKKLCDVRRIKDYHKNHFEYTVSNLYFTIT